MVQLCYQFTVLEPVFIRFSTEESKKQTPSGQQMVNTTGLYFLGFESPQILSILL